MRDQPNPIGQPAEEALAGSFLGGPAGEDVTGRLTAESLQRAAGERLAGVRAVAGQAYDLISREVYDRVTKVVATITGCEAKVSAAIGLLQSQVKATVDRVNGQVELDAALALAAAQEIASRQGCSFPTADELAPYSPRWPTSMSPMGSPGFTPTYQMSPYAPLQPPPNFPRPAGSAAAGRNYLDDPILTPNPTPSPQPPYCDAPRCGEWVGDECRPPNGVSWSWQGEPYEDTIYGQPWICTASCRSNVDGGSGQPTISCYMVGNPSYFITHPNPPPTPGCIAGCGEQPIPPPPPVPPPRPPAPTPPPRPPLPPLPPTPPCDQFCDPETGESIECCETATGWVCEPGDPADCPPPPKPPEPPKECCNVDVTVNPELKIKPPDCADSANARLTECFRPPQPPPRGKPSVANAGNWGEANDCDKVDAALGRVGQAALSLISAVFSPGLMDPNTPPEKVALDVAARMPLAFGWIALIIVPPAVGAIRVALRTNAEQRGCGDPKLMLPMIAKAFWEIVGNWTGIDTSDTIRDIAYAVNTQCPTMLPSSDECHTAFLRNEITLEEWRCWVSANNKIIRPAERMMMAGRAKPNISDSISLLRRKFTSYEEFVENMRGNGVMKGRDLQSFFELSKLIPPYSDLVRMMVRDSFDDAVAARFGYDEGFRDKFNGKAVEWATAQGVEEDVMKYLWRAHWRLVSPTQAFEMLHRNRPGRVPDDLVVREEDVLALLQIDDLAPWWQRRLTSISYRVMRLVDIRKQYNYGVYGNEELINQLEDRGYTNANSILQQQAMEHDRDLFLLSREEAKGFVAGFVTRAEVLQAWLTYRVGTEQSTRLIGFLELKKARQQRKKCVAALKKRYLGGEIDPATATTGMIALGFEPFEASQWVATWTCELQTRSREITAQVMCGWLGQGLITRMEMMQRLVRIGYTPGDAQRVLRSCMIGIWEKKRRLQKQIDDMKDKAKNAIDREKNKMFKEGERKEKEKARQNKGVEDMSEEAKIKLVRTARRWTKWSGWPLKQSLTALENYVCELRARKGYSIKGAVDLVTEIVLAAIENEDLALRARYLEIRSTLEDNPRQDMDCAAEVGPDEIGPLPGDQLEGDPIPDSMANGVAH